ncbi:hypothetical protein KUTeg_005058 [Tegillarca granosa]|uniref:Endonuclease/exonuclease/phosphatase domain-containing protein n=1 Tax=Tegillarca granosa TaxID=220873 RepID=A0ABQ9FIN7_TEGGR|nr:hypothetical protein KUTeg_005058 [Tegillarca granosa]
MMIGKSINARVSKKQGTSKFNSVATNLLATPQGACAKNFENSEETLSQLSFCSQEDDEEHNQSHSLLSDIRDHNKRKRVFYSNADSILNKSDELSCMITKANRLEDMDQYSFKESIWCEINLCGNDRLIIRCVYRSPSSSTANDKNLVKLFNKVSKQGSYILIAGDFNMREIDWSDMSTNSGEMSRSYQFLECIRDVNFTQHISWPTRNRCWVYLKKYFWLKVLVNSFNGSGCDSSDEDDEDDLEDDVRYSNLFPDKFKLNKDLKRARAAGGRTNIYLTEEEINKNAEELITEEEKEKRRAEKRRAKKKRRRERKKLEKALDDDEDDNQIKEVCIYTFKPSVNDFWTGVGITSGHVLYDFLTGVGITSGQVLHDFWTGVA